MTFDLRSLEEFSIQVRALYNTRTIRSLIKQKEKKFHQSNDIRERILTSISEAKND